MRIGIDATCLPPAPAGAGRYIRGLLTALAGLETEHEYVVFIKESDRGWFRSLERPRFTCVTASHSIRPARLLWELAIAPGVIDRFQFDVWHAPHYIVPLSSGRCRMVVTFHDMAFYLFPELYPLLKRLIFQWALPRAARTADRIIADSQATKDDTAHILRVDPDRIAVIHPGIDLVFRPVEDEKVLTVVRERYQIEEPYILAVGTIDRRKNLVTLVQAYHALLEREGTDCCLVLVGQRGNGYPSLIREIASRRLTDRVRLVGYVADEDMPALYTGARLFVSASRYEGFGFPVLEAMACGTPVLTSPCPSIMETTSGDWRMIIDPLNVRAWCDRMATALSNPPDHHTRITDGSRFVGRYSWSDVARQTLRVYEEVSDQSGTSPDSGRRLMMSRPMLTATDASRTVIPTFKDSIVNDASQPSRSNNPTSNALTHAILKTLVYADLFDYPLSAVEVHRGLIGHQTTVEQVVMALYSSGLSALISERNGLYMLKGRESLGGERATRSACAARLLQRNHRLLRWLCACPFVRMVALSGGIAFENCYENSDIDLFLIVDSGRVWSTYAFLAGMAKLIRKRELLCLNYLIGRADDSGEEHDFFTAHQIAGLKPIYGWEQFRRFTAANWWVTEHLPQWNSHATWTANHGATEKPLPAWLSRVKFVMELLLELPVFDPIDWFIYRMYGRHLARKTAGMANGHVRLARDRIKLHTNDHGRRILDLFERRMTDVTCRDEMTSRVSQ